MWRASFYSFLETGEGIKVYVVLFPSNVSLNSAKANLESRSVTDPSWIHSQSPWGTGKDVDSPDFVQLESMAFLHDQCNFDKAWCCGRTFNWEFQRKRNSEKLAMCLRYQRRSGVLKRDFRDWLRITSVLVQPDLSITASSNCRIWIREWRTVRVVQLSYTKYSTDTLPFDYRVLIKYMWCTLSTVKAKASIRYYGTWSTRNGLRKKGKTENMGIIHV